MENGTEASADDLLLEEIPYECPKDISETTKAVLRARSAQDSDAWTYLFNTYYGAVYGVIMRRLRNVDDAHEIAQYTFQRAFRKIDQLDDPGKFPGWIKRIAIRSAINHAARTKKFNSDGCVKALEDTRGKEASHRLIGQERVSALHRIMNLLEPKDKDLLFRFYFQGMSLKRLSAEHDVPLGTIKRRLHTARDRLRTLLIEVRHFEYAENL